MKPIYPVPLKPRSSITSWSSWPADVVETLREWNRKGRLSFYSPGRVFKCTKCEGFCEGGYTVCHLAPTASAAKRHRAVDPYCDDCIIKLAREAS